MELEVAVAAVHAVVNHRPRSRGVTVITEGRNAAVPVPHLHNGFQIRISN